MLLQNNHIDKHTKFRTLFTLTSDNMVKVSKEVFKKATKSDQSSKIAIQ